MDETTKQKLTELLMLVVDNNKTSASTPGLKRRAKNRQQMTELLLEWLELEEDAADDLYWEWQENRTRD